MKYGFNDILNADIYENTKVMFVLGKHVWFNNMVCDTLRAVCTETDTGFNSISIDTSLDEEFEVEDNQNDSKSNSVSFDTFMDVLGVSSINGKWFCMADYSILTSKQKQKLMTYIKDPSDNGVLVITSTDWMQYKDILKNRALVVSKYSHIMQLSFPRKAILKNIVTQCFNEKGFDIEPSAVDFFLMRMSSAYDDYEEQIEVICEIHKGEKITLKDIKEYMKGVENFIIDDFINELVKPMSSDKTNSKKVLKIMVALEDEYTSKSLVYQLLKRIDEYIDYRILINQGYIPVGIKYFFDDTINSLPNKDKYEKVNEWVFRKKAYTASLTSLRDWQYMKMILQRAIDNVRLSEDEMDKKCQKALYELATRSVMNPDRLNNVIGISNILNKQLEKIDSIVFDESKLGG